MGIKSIVDGCWKPTPPPIQYPCLMRNPLTGSVVLFTAAGAGTKVADAGGPEVPTRKIGDTGSYWAEPSFWEHFEGSVTLMNAEG